MNKLKHKTPPKNFFRYLFDEYILFRRDFVIETAAPASAVERQLRRLNNQKHGCFPRGKTTVRLSPVGDMSHFVIEAQGGQKKRGTSQSASAEGTLESNQDGLTVITGKVVMSGYGYWIMIAIWLAQILYMLITIDAGRAVELSALLLLTGLMMLIPAIYWILMYSDRNMLLKHIYEAVRQAESDKITEKIKSNDIYENNNPSPMSDMR